MPPTPQQRGKKVALATLADILPRMTRGEGPVDLDALAQRVAREVEEAVKERVEGTLLAEGRLTDA